MSSNFCVMCGAEIPEGSQVCFKCEIEAYKGTKRNDSERKDEIDALLYSIEKRRGLDI